MEREVAPQFNPNSVALQGAIGVLEKGGDMLLIGGIALENILLIAHRDENMK